MNVQIDSLEAIKKLGELKELGLVTEEEFQEKKALIRLKEKQGALAATQEAPQSRHRSKKRKEVENKDTPAKPRVSSNGHKKKKRRKIATLEGTTMPASNPDDWEKKGGFSSALFVGLGIFVVACLGAVLWLLLM